jgi:exodeoxyribonuclease-3
MKVATWNVNSIRTRLERLLAWLERARPDVVCLQELKGVDASFPHSELEAAGYHAAVYGEKTYNGVAILSRDEPAEVERGLGDTADPQARLIAARIRGVSVLSVYVPNGQTVGSEKFSYKIEWLGRLRAYLERRFDPAAPLLVCGDFNVAPADLDVANPERWADTVLCHPAARTALEDVRGWGLVDLLRRQHPEEPFYSWWDYRMLAFPKNDGLRIDHIFASAPLAERCVAAEIDRNERKGQKPSDHAPVVVVLEEGAAPAEL